jgi:putative membrane protein
LLWGASGWVIEMALTLAPVRKLAVFCVQPIVAFLIFNLAQGLLHVPEVTDTIIRNHGLHLLVHVYLMVSSFILWAPVISPTPLLPRLSYPMQLVYLMVQSAIPTVIYAPLTFAEEVVYPFYGAAPRIWDLSAITDQQMAGLLMKIGGGFIMWGWIFVVFFRWFGRSDAGDLQDDFQPVDDLTPSSAIRAAEDALRDSQRR